ncbi:thiol oxidase [Malassezia japonica]|uniref:Sulfhydryl oxidase n=1 Tax=Malassezia japonica TaxID=223818 RepID=A0AAF0EWF2_9BASI|nr:thiol oxidase [Malassezia japonica]WFD38226.1 thiol oxidase [Malassezia japonica]
MFSAFRAAPGSWRARVHGAFMARVRRNPTLFFGVPFIGSIVFASFALTSLTQIRYIQHEQRHKTLSQEENLKLKSDRKPLDIREEYFKLQAKDDGLDDWEPKRVARPAGMPEWGGVPQPAAPGKEAVAADTSQHSGSSFFARRVAHAEEAHEADTTPAPPARRPPTVLGPDGKPCRACNARTAFGAAMRTQAKKHDACPPDIEELGRSTWTFLHSAAAHYPDEPSDVQRTHMRSVLEALPHVYPCATCAAELHEEYGRQAPEARADAVDSATALQVYVCTLHNEVNARLGKKVWDCSDLKRLRHRWYEPPEDREC